MIHGALDIVQRSLASEQQSYSSMQTQERRLESDVKYFQGMHGVTIYWAFLLDPHNNLVKQGGHCSIPGSGQQNTSLLKLSPGPVLRASITTKCWLLHDSGPNECCTIPQHMVNVCSNHPEISLPILTYFVFWTITLPHSKFFILKTHSDPISRTVELVFLSL